MNDICYIFECSYRTPSGYCGSTGGYAACQYRLIHFRDNLKQTNGDKYRAMTDEELAYSFAISTSCHRCPVQDCGGGQLNCVDIWLDWLKQEVQE